MTRDGNYTGVNRVYFAYMGAVWSCGAMTRRILIWKAEHDEAFDLSDYEDIRQIKRAPSGVVVEALVGRRNLAPRN